MGRSFMAVCLFAGGVFHFATLRGSDSLGSTFLAGEVPVSTPQPRANSLCSGFKCEARDSSRVVMHGQGQGGRNLYDDGVLGLPRLKGAKKMSRMRKRKNYGSYGARQLPRRYPLYDILEELDETLPQYTIISEPEEPLEPVLHVPLNKRYPWAGKLEKVHPRKMKREHGRNPNRMEPLFGSWTGAGSPPRNRMQKYVLRRGFPSYNYPPWLNHPGTPGWKIDPDEPWRKHRGPGPDDQLIDGGKDNSDYDDDYDDDDDLLEGLEGKAIA